MRRLSTLAFVATLSACGGGSGDTSSDGGKPCVLPAATAGTGLANVDPGKIFVGRTAKITITGTGTHFTSDSKVSSACDPELKIERVDAKGPTVLEVSLTVGDDAVIGPHDLVVTTGAEVAVNPNALTILPTLQVDPAVAGVAVTNGGPFDFAVKNLDTANPLSTDDWGGVRGGTGLTIFRRSGDSTSARFAGTAIADPFAPAGGFRINLKSTVAGKTLGYGADPLDPNAPKLTARPPKVLTLGNALAGEAFRVPRASGLYQFETTEADQVLIVTFNGVGASPTTRIAGAFAPASARFADGQLTDSTLFAQTRTALGYMSKKGTTYGSFFLIDPSGSPAAAPAAYEYSITPRAVPASPVELKEPTIPDTPEKPLAEITLDRPHFGINGRIDTDFDADWIRFKAAHTGRVYVQAIGATRKVWVKLYTADCHRDLAPNYSKVGYVVALEGGMKQGSDYCVQVGYGKLDGDNVTDYSLIIASDLGFSK